MLRFETLDVEKQILALRQDSFVISCACRRAMRACALYRRNGMTKIEEKFDSQVIRMRGTV